MDVLLVDDSRVMRQLVRRTLRQAGFDLGQVVEAENAKEALAKLAGWRPHVVLSDWNMPEMTGIEMLEALRAGGNTVPVGFVTSESTPVMRTRALETGASFLMTKPFTAEDFQISLGCVGIRPSGGAAVAGASPIQADAFSEKAIALILGRLVGQTVGVTPGPKLTPMTTACLSATWVNDKGELLYAGFCDAAGAAYLGSAIGLRPVATARESLTSGVLPEAVQADVREVFNVLSRAFNDAGSVHVRLERVTFPPAPRLSTAVALDVRAPSRRDYALQVAGYGPGRLSLVSVSPSFVAA